MFSLIFKKVFSSANEKFIRKINPIVAQINYLEAAVSQLTDVELQQQTVMMQGIIRSSEATGKAINDILDTLLPKAFAVVREASRRVLDKRHYDVQLIGGIVLHRGMIAEMRTGEGKTLAATLPVYLNALSGKGVHVVTTNDYLVTRDVEWMGVLYEFLGLSVGKIISNMSEEDKRQAYLADITYGTNNEFGFDFLRDNLKFESNTMIQRSFNYVVVDEVDSVLIDEARTPLIISGKTNDDPTLYSHINSIIVKLDKSNYEIDEKARNVLLTEVGNGVLEAILKKSHILDEQSSLYDIENITILHHIDQSLKAHTLFKKNVDYLVKDGNVLIIDEHTGRIMDGRRYGDGLHQAIEAKEGVKIQNENQTIASITFQNYFRMYSKLSGMTGTAIKESVEFAEVYGLQVISIPTNAPIRCINEDDIIYRTAKEKYNAIITEIKNANSNKQPVLVGTTSIEKSEYISSLLNKASIKHNVLNAKYHEAEAEIIGQAGRAGAVTIATNMAGRGTDIVLGGNPEMLAKKIIHEKHHTTCEDNPELFESILNDLKKETLHEQRYVKEVGGLLVIGTERHESRRIDDQLRGRAGRQGDPGRTKFYLSMEDDLMRLFGSEKISGLLVRLGLKEGEAIVHPWVSKSLERAQQKVESRNYEIRKNILQFDDVMNDQRNVIYSRRNELMNTNIELLEKFFNSLCYERIKYYIDMDLDEVNLDMEMHRIFNAEGLIKAYVEINGEIYKGNKSALLEFIYDKVMAIHRAKTEVIGAENLVSMMQHIYLMTLDYLWKEHLHNLDQVRLGINLRSYGQKNPLIEYKNEAFHTFKNMWINFEEQLIERLFKLTVVQEESTKNNNTTTHINRNQQCHCGSSKRYKHCHGKLIV